MFLRPNGTRFDSLAAQRDAIRFSCGPTGRDSIAQANGLGDEASQRRKPQRGATDSIPNRPFVPFQFMATQPLAKLVLERPLPMMRFLVGDVLPDLFHVRWTHGKGCSRELVVAVSFPLSRPSSGGEAGCGGICFSGRLRSTETGRC